MSSQITANYDGEGNQLLDNPATVFDGGLSTAQSARPDITGVVASTDKNMLVAPSSIIPPLNQLNRFPILLGASTGKWVDAMYSVRAGIRNARIILIADSTGAGNGANGSVGFTSGGRDFCPSVLLARYLNADSNFPSQAGAFFGNVGALNLSQLKAWDTRLGGTGWAPFGVGFNAISGSSKSTTF